MSDYIIFNRSTSRTRRHGGRQSLSFSLLIYPFLSKITSSERGESRDPLIADGLDQKSIREEFSDLLKLRRGLAHRRKGAIGVFIDPLLAIASDIGQTLEFGAAVGELAVGGCELNTVDDFAVILFMSCRRNSVRSRRSRAG